MGTDPYPVVGNLTRRLRCYGLTIASWQRWRTSSGGRRRRTAAVSFQVYAPPRGDGPTLLRSVSNQCSGGQWKLSLAGIPQWFEQTEQYGAAAGPYRFTGEMLERYCRAVGVDVFDAEGYGPVAALVETRVRRPWGASTVSLAQAQARLGIQPGPARPESTRQDVVDDPTQTSPQQRQRVVADEVDQEGSPVQDDGPEQQITDQADHDQRPDRDPPQDA